MEMIVGRSGGPVLNRRRQALATPASRGVLAAVVLGLAWPGGLAAQGGGGLAPENGGASERRVPPTECCLELLFPISARAAALGRALTAFASPDAVWSNPAGLAPLDGDHFVMHRSSLVGEASAFSILLTPDIVGTIGLSYQLLDFGEIESRDEFNQPTGVLSLRNHLLVASFATQVGAGISAGINYKFYQIRNRCSGSCGGPEALTRDPSTQAVDVGIQFRPEWAEPLQLGLAVTNLGFPLQVINVQQSDPLPTRLRLGVALEVLKLLRSEGGTAAWIAVELEDNWHLLGSPTASVGVEVVAADVLFMRAGYVPGEGLGTGAAFGVGLHFSRFTIGIARPVADTVLDPDREPFQLTFGMSF